MMNLIYILLQQIGINLPELVNDLITYSLKGEKNDFLTFW